MSKINKDIIGKTPLAIWTSLLLMVFLLIPFASHAETVTNLGLNQVNGTLIGYRTDSTDMYTAIKIKTPLVNDKLVSVKLYLKKYGNPTDNLVITLRGDNSDIPDSTIYGTQTINGSLLTTNHTEYTFTFNTTIAPQTYYWLVITRSLGTYNQNDFYELSTDTNYTNCNIKQSTNGSSWGTYLNRCAYGKFTTDKTTQSGGQTSNGITEEMWTVLNENARTNAWFFSIILSFAIFTFGYFVIRY
jgi:hypothetical protein